MAKYIWMVDTIERHGTITRKRLSDLWSQSPFGNGTPLARRTFYNYRAGIADSLGIDIEINKVTNEYYIACDGTDTASKRQQWLLDSMSISSEQVERPLEPHPARAGAFGARVPAHYHRCHAP